MFTVLHAPGDREDMRILYASKTVWFYPEKDGAPAYVTILDGAHILDEGVAIVMNENGKTVAKYKLG